MISVVYFGSFNEFSVATLSLLLSDPNINIVTVVTSPPRPGNRGLITPNPVETFSRKHQLPLLTPTNLQSDLPPLPPADFILVAGYGLLIPPTYLDHPKYLALNAHPSLLPQLPGRFPIEWALLLGHRQVGLSIISMSEKFDAGQLIFQKSFPVGPTDTRISLYQNAYLQTGRFAPQVMGQIIFGDLKPWPQIQTDVIYARGLTRQDGFIPWPAFINFVNQASLPPEPWPLLAEINSHLSSPISPPTLIRRMFRALNPWPGLWTINPQGKRLIITGLEPLLVQPEGKKPTPWVQIAHLYS